MANQIGKPRAGATAAASFPVDIPAEYIRLENGKDVEQAFLELDIGAIEAKLTAIANIDIVAVENVVSDVAILQTDTAGLQAAVTTLQSESADLTTRVVELETNAITGGFI